MLYLSSNPTAHEFSSHLSVSGGITLTSQDLSVIRAGCADLKALDLYKCKGLKEIYLDCAAVDVHICILGCPDLRKIVLPPGCNAYIHIDSGDVPPQLICEGIVASLDACWTRNDELRTFKYETQTLSKLNGAWIGPVNTYTSLKDKPQANLCVLLEDQTSCLQSLNLSLPDPIQVMLLPYITNLRSLALKGASLAVLEISAAVNLESIIFETDLQNTVVSRSPKLKQLTGAANLGTLHLRERSGDKQGVFVDLRVDELFLVDSPTHTLKTTQPSDISLIRCNALKDVEFVTGSAWVCEGRIPKQLIGKSRIIMNEGLLKQLQERVLAADVEAWPEFRAILTYAAGSRHVPQILMTLKALLDSQIPLNEIWQARCELYTRHHLPHHFKASKPLTPAVTQQALSTWRWMFPSDLGQDGWRADFEIWRACWMLEGQKNCVLAMTDELTKPTSGYSAILDANWLIGVQLSENNLRNHESILAFLSDIYRIYFKFKMAHLSGYMIDISHWILRLERSRKLDVTAVLGQAQKVITQHSSYEDVLKYFAAELLINPVEARTQLVRLAANPPECDCEQRMSKAEFKRAAMALVLGGRLTSNQLQNELSVA